MKTTLVAAFGLCVLVATTNGAEVVMTTAVADSTVDLLQPDTTFSTGDLVAAKQGNPEEVATDLRFFYAQFDLPDGLTGQDIATLNSAELELNRSGPDLSLTYYAYGVFDGLDAATADSYTWNSGVGYDPANNLVKFLGPDEISYYSDPAESAFVGTLAIGPAGSGPFNFSGTPQSPTAAAALEDLILNDTDGRVTFYVGVRQNFGVTPLNTIASIESLDLAGPKLILDFVRIPEPTSGLLACGLFAVLLAGYRGRLPR